MKPSLYLYTETENGIELYFNEISTIEGLETIDKLDEIKLHSIGATLYKDYGFATKENFPEFQRTEELMTFLQETGDIGLVDLEIEIVGKGSMRSHDDGECHFMLQNKKEALAILKKIAPVHQTDLIIAALLENSGMYIAFDENNTITKFTTFEDYVKKTS